MRVISRKALREFCVVHPDAEGPLAAWYAEAKRAAWETPHDIKASYGTASILSDGRVVFNVGGNKYRLVCYINYALEIVYIRFVGTHEGTVRKFVYEAVSDGPSLKP